MVEILSDPVFWLCILGIWLTGFASGFVAGAYVQERGERKRSA